MPTNEQRREAAKRKLERQLTRRAQRARKRKQLTIAGSILAVVAVVAGGALVYVLTKSDGSVAVKCEYPASPPSQPAAKKVDPPSTDGVKKSDDTYDVTMDTSQGPIGLVLDNSKSPCTVNSFLSLVKQNYFDGTTCHRLTNSAQLKVLQCGDPSGTGAGGPGYSFADEYPISKDPTAMVAGDYKRGTLAMANAGPDTNGSQFFLVFGDTDLPPDYTKFGTIDEAGLQTLDKIAAGGIVPADRGPEDGKPVLPVDVKTVVKN